MIKRRIDYMPYTACVFCAIIIHTCIIRGNIYITRVSLDSSARLYHDSSFMRMAAGCLQALPADLHDVCVRFFCCFFSFESFPARKRCRDVQVAGVTNL